MNSDALKERILRIANRDGMDLDAIKQSISELDAIELFIWLSNQDNSLRYHIALELDIPLQHLEHTCSTIKIIDQLSD